MTRSRVKALHVKVNSILSTLDLNTTLDGMLPNAMFYMSSDTSLERSTPRVAQHRTRKEKENHFSRRPQRRAGTAAPYRPALPPSTPRHCRPEHPGTAGQGTPTLPPGAPRHCQPRQSQLHLNRPLSSCGYVYFMQMTKLPLLRIWAICISSPT